MVSGRYPLLELLGRISDFLRVGHKAEALMPVLDIESPLDRAQEARCPFVAPFSQGMVEKDGFDDLDLMLAKMDHIAEFEKKRFS